MDDVISIVVLVLIVVGALAGLITGGHGVFMASRSALQRNTTGDFFHNWSRTTWGNVWILIAVFFLAALVYFLLGIIISIRLLCGFGGGITRRHVRAAIIGASIPAVIGAVVCGLKYNYDYKLSIWWIMPVLIALVFFSVAGLTYPGGETKKLSESIPLSVSHPLIAKRPEPEPAAKKSDESELCYLCGKPLQRNELTARVCQKCRE